MIVLSGVASTILDLVWPALTLNEGAPIRYYVDSPTEIKDKDVYD
jgi:hypothetical protein